jgi:hypothetical protein
MKLNKKQKLFIFLLIIFAVTGVEFFLSYLDAQRNINVLLITIDALRPDHLGCYGYSRNTSPNIDLMNLLGKESYLPRQSAKGHGLSLRLPQFLLRFIRPLIKYIIGTVSYLQNYSPWEKF